MSASAPIADVIDAIAAFKDGREPELRLLPPCKRCGAEPGAPCVRPDGAPYVEGRRRHPETGTARFHRPRGAAYCRLYNSMCVKAWRMDLCSGRPRCSLVREVRSSPGYIALVAAGLVPEIEEA